MTDPAKEFSAYYGSPSCCDCPAHLPEGKDGGPDCMVSGNCLSIFDEIQIGKEEASCK